MTLFLLFASGASLATSLMFFVLSVKKPVIWKYLVFAVMVLMLSARFLFLRQYYLTSEYELSLEILRQKTNIGLIYFALYPVFICLYTDFKPPRIAAYGFYGIVLSLAFYNNFSPYSAQFAVPPHMSLRHVWGGEVINILEAKDTWINRMIDFYTSSIMIAGVIVLLKRRPKSLLIILGTSTVVLFYLIDQTRDRIAGDWPYLTEFGVVLMATLMTIQLTRDFREKDQKLSAALKAAFEVRDQLNTPLQTIILDIKMLEERGLGDKELLARMSRAVSRLSDLGKKLKS